MNTIQNLSLKESYNFILQEQLYFDNIVLLSEHVLKKNYLPCEIEYKKYYTYTQIINIVEQFLKDMDIEYYNLFNEKINNGEFNIYNIDENKKCNEIPNFEGRDNSSINIPFTHTLEDVYNIVHEFFHSTNYKKYETNNRYKFTEFISILSESLLEIYLSNNGYDEVYIELNNRLFCVYSDALKTLILNETMNLSINNQKIEIEQLYYSFMDKYPKANFLLEKVDKALLEYNFLTLNSSKYVIGTFFSLRLKQSLPYEQLKNIFKEINQNINELSELDVYRGMNINLEVKDNKILFKENDLKIILDCYDNECNNNFQKNYKIKVKK